ncbi:MAG: TraR/DksA family transcriptional regulator [Planctomycetales bacterium]|nr:TraR/DksA family transcriptional regulator [Planctomycetales bacterium]
MKRSSAIAHLKTVLLNRREGIRAALRGDLNELQKLNLSAGDSADCAQDSTHGEMSCQLAKAESLELSQIEDALDRFDQGDFGTCIGCNLAIPIGRLNALPYATLCIACQVKLEKSGFSNWSELQDAAYDSV